MFETKMTIFLDHRKAFEEDYFPKIGDWHELVYNTQVNKLCTCILTCKFLHLCTGSGQTLTRPECFSNACKNVDFPEPMFPSTITV